MLEDKFIESLSRYLDGDLDPVERDEIRTLLESDAELQKEFANLQDLRRSLAGLAAREHPPATLDALVEPLMQKSASSNPARPWAKWLATAAVVVLGATVVFEVNRRDLPGSPEAKSVRMKQGPREEPTAPIQTGPETSQPENKGERPRGAIDRLIASPDPEVDVLSEEPPALEVIGPLQTASDSTQGPPAKNRGEPNTASPATEDKDRPNGENEKFGAAAPPGAGATSSTRLSIAEDRPDGLEIEQPTTRAKLYVFMEEKTAWLGFEPRIRCESGRYALRLRVEAGVVRDVWPVGRPPAAPSQHLRAGEIVLGLEIEGVPDGEYASQVTIEPRTRQRP